MRRGRALALSLSFVVSCLGALAPAAAQDDDASETTSETRPERRTVPDYDGRPPPGPTPEEIAVSIPRAIFSPVHLVLEHLVRRPIGQILTTAEHDRWDIIQLLPFAQIRPTWGIAPTALLELGRAASIGLLVWMNDLVLPHNELRLHLGFGGPDFLRATITDRQRIDEHTSIELLAEGWQRADQFFTGIGPFADEDFVARYGRRWIDLTAALAIRPWRASLWRTSFGVSINELYDTDWLDSGPPPQQTLTDAVANGFFPGMNEMPAGWPGYTAYWQRVDAAIDSRQVEPESAGGVRVDGYVEHAFETANANASRWLLWGGGLGGFIDIDRGRTIGLHAEALLSTALGSAEIPFTELPDLGLNMQMPGFWPGWLRGESALVSVLDYRYPIGPMLAGFLSVAVGNTFGPMFESITPGLMRMGFGFGLRGVGDPDQSFIAMIGMGTETFDQGLGPTTFRIVVGTTRGF